MSWNKKIKERIRKNKIKGCFLLSFLIFLSLSLFSYHPQDSSFNFVGLSTKVSNYCGFIGASLADITYQLLGFAGAWLLVLGALILALKLLLRPLNEKTLSSFLLFACFHLSFINLAELHFSSLVFFEGEVSLGGFFAQSLVNSLKPLLGAVGMGVIIWSVFLSFLLFYIQSFFPFLIALPRKSLLLLYVKSPLFFKKVKNWLFKLNPFFLLVSAKKTFSTLVCFIKSLAKNRTPLKTKSGELNPESSKLNLFQKQIPLKSWFLSQFKGLPEDNNKPEDLTPSSSIGESLNKSSFSKEDILNKPLSNSSKEDSSSSLLSSSAPGQSPESSLEKKPSVLKNSDNKLDLSFDNEMPSSTQAESANQDPSLNPIQTSPLKKKSSSLSFLPSLDILPDPPSQSKKISSKDIEILSKKLLDKLEQFSIKGEIKAIKTGPALVLFEYKPEDHVKVSQIKKMESDLSLALSSESIRIIAPIPGRDVVGIEASMPYREMVYLKSLLAEEEFSKARLPLVLGRRADNKVGIKDLARIPHLLVAGSTGSGKSMFIISFISSLLLRHSPESLKLLLVDPKQVDLSSFKEVPHLLAPIISSSTGSVQSLHWAIQEMEKRYRSLAEFKVRDHKSFNEKIKKLSHKEKQEHEIKNEELEKEETYYFESLPLLCLVVEEFGDLMADPSVRRPIENAVVRLAQKARASGIHLVLAMQSPRKDVVTGLIKTNIPGRISFKVASGTDSRIILDDTGAERLLSHGDMLFLEPGSLKATRYHGPLIRDQEVSSIVSYWKSQSLDEVFYEESLMDILDKKSSSSSSFKASSLKKDPMYDEIIEFIKTCDVISASLLQRKFQIGYPRAGRLIQDLFDKGLIGPARGSKPRQVLISQ